MSCGREIRLTACEMPAGVDGFILFHISAKRKYFTIRKDYFTFYTSEIFHLKQGGV